MAFIQGINFIPSPGRLIFIKFGFRISLQPRHERFYCEQKWCIYGLKLNTYTIPFRFLLSISLAAPLFFLLLGHSYLVLLYAMEPDDPHCSGGLDKKSSPSMFVSLSSVLFRKKETKRLCQAIFDDTYVYTFVVFPLSLQTRQFQI